MNKQRWVILAATVLGIFLMASPYGVTQDQRGKEPRDKNDPRPKGKLGPPRPGTVLPPDFQDLLRFTPEQKKALAELQKEVDARLAKILTDAQKRVIQDLIDNGPKAFDAIGKEKDKDRN